VAIFWGYKWDPLDALFSRLVKNTGTKSEDIFYQLREDVIKKREGGEKFFQFWIQARLKNGYVYQGEFSFIGYRQESMSRELLLANVTFSPNSSRENEKVQPQPMHYDYVLIDVGNCESLEILFTNNAP
jgi:hypothetical protein